MDYTLDSLLTQLLYADSGEDSDKCIFSSCEFLSDNGDILDDNGILSEPWLSKYQVGLEASFLTDLAIKIDLNQRRYEQEIKLSCKLNKGEILQS